MYNTEYMLIKKAFLKTEKLTASMFPYQIFKFFKNSCSEEHTEAAASRWRSNAAL